MEECTLCNEFNNKPENNYFEMYLKQPLMKQNSQIKNRILYEEEDFVIIPTVGPLLKGHILICPKMHFLSFSQMNKELLNKAEKLKNKIRKVFKKTYNTGTAFFEHGMLSCESKGGACTSHAHLHCLATDVDVMDDFFKYSFNVRNINKFENIKTQTERNNAYLYYENQNETKVIMDSPIVESQFIRKLFAIRLKEIHKAHWRYSIYSPEIYEMIKILPNSIKKL